MYRVLAYFGSWELSEEGIYDNFYEAQDVLQEALESYLEGIDPEDIEAETEVFYFNSRIEEI